MEVTILNKNGRSIRQLTNDERKFIDALQLDQNEKDFIAQKWESNPSKLNPKKAESNWFNTLIQLFRILLPFALFIRFFDPSAGILQGIFGASPEKMVEMVIKIGFFLVGVIILCEVIFVIILVAYKIGLVTDKKLNDLSPAAIGILKKKNKVRRYFFDFIDILTVVGLILASHQIIAFIYLVLFVTLEWLNKSIKRTIKAQVIERVKSETQNQ